MSILLILFDIHYMYLYSTNIFWTIKLGTLGTFLIFNQTLLLHLCVYIGGSVGGAPNAQKEFVKTVWRFCKAPYLLFDEPTKLGSNFKWRYQNDIHFDCFIN